VITVNRFEPRRPRRPVEFPISVRFEGERAEPRGSLLAVPGTRPRAAFAAGVPARHRVDATHRRGVAAAGRVILGNPQAGSSFSGTDQEEGGSVNFQIVQFARFLGL
jgi:hypothetical protein